jgi:hypothetical protein
MTIRTLDRPVPADTFRRPSPPPAADDPMTVALRAARFAEISAETAEWIAADLVRREAGGDLGYAPAADRIRLRAARYRTDARRHRLEARRLATR